MAQDFDDEESGEYEGPDNDDWYHKAWEAKHPVLPERSYEDIRRDARQGGSGRDVHPIRGRLGMEK